MNRRGFLKALAIVPLGIAASQYLPDSHLEPIPDLSPFRVDERGMLSLEGQSIFPVYGQSGGLVSHAVRYWRLPSGRIYAQHIKLVDYLQ